MGKVFIPSLPWTRDEPGRVETRSQSFIGERPDEVPPSDQGGKCSVNRLSSWQGEGHVAGSRASSYPTTKVSCHAEKGVRV